jgi:hypothetical protein
MIFFIKRDVAKKGERYSPNTDSFVSDLVPLVKEGISERDFRRRGTENLARDENEFPPPEE